MMNEKRCKAPIYEPEKNVVFHAVLRPLEAAAQPPKPPQMRGSLHQAKELWRRVEQGQVNIAVCVQRNADAEFRVACGQDVAAMSRGRNERRLRLFNGCVVGDIFPRSCV